MVLPPFTLGRGENLIKAQAVVIYDNATQAGTAPVVVRRSSGGGAGGNTNAVRDFLTKYMQGVVMVAALLLPAQYKYMLFILSYGKLTCRPYKTAHAL